MRGTRYLFVLAGLAGAGILHGNSLTYTVTPAGGYWNYNFKLTNTGDTGGALYDLFLSVATDISNVDTSGIGTPTGWGDPTGGLLFYGSDFNPNTSFIEWAADGSGLYDLAIGDFLSEFIVRLSQEPIGPILYGLNGSSTLAPATQVSGVPEPATLSMMVLFILSLSVMAGRRTGGPPKHLKHLPPR